MGLSGRPNLSDSRHTGSSPPCSVIKFGSSHHLLRPSGFMGSFVVPCAPLTVVRSGLGHPGLVTRSSVRYPDSKTPSLGIQCGRTRRDMELLVAAASSLKCLHETSCSVFDSGTPMLYVQLAVTVSILALDSLNEISSSCQHFEHSLERFGRSISFLSG